MDELCSAIDHKKMDVIDANWNEIWNAEYADDVGIMLEDCVSSLEAYIHTLYMYLGITYGSQ